MRQRFAVATLIGLLVAMCASPVFADITAAVRGVCTDQEGHPITGAVVLWVNSDNGVKYELKTNAKGEYFSLGIALGRYTVTLLKDGKDVFHFNNVSLQATDKTLDFDLKKEMQMASQGQAQGVPKEEAQKQQETQGKVAKENATVKVLNEKLAAARADMQAGNFDQAVATMNEAIAIDANRDVVWATLGDANRGAASKQTDPALKAKNLADAAMDYQKAVDLKNQQMAEGKVKDPDANKKLAGYYNNMGDAFAKNGKTDEAVNSYNKAVQLDPSDAGKYYFNEGATMTNANVKNDAKMRTAASEAFDKAIAADPNRADAYYWKGTNLIGMATLKGDKMEAPPGTAEAFQKYLELQPTGPHADEAKAMITSLGASVETSFGKKKSGKK